MNVTKEDFVAGLARERVRRANARALEQRERETMYYEYLDDIMRQYNRRQIRRYKQGR
jgi:hypothetical protein